MPKEVRYDIYCKRCVHANKSASNEPCDSCLGKPDNDGTQTPVNFKKAKALINYLLPDPNVVCYTRDHLKSANWIDREPTDAELKQYFTVKEGDWYENN